MDGQIEIELRARLFALEHAVVILFSQSIFNMAREAPEGAAVVHAQYLADGLRGTMLESTMPEAFKTPMIDALSYLGARVIENARTWEDLGRPDH